MWALLAWGHLEMNQKMYFWRIKILSYVIFDFCITCFCNNKIFPLSDIFSGKGSANIVRIIKHLPILNLQTWFLYLRHVLYFLWSWYNLTKSYNCGCLCLSGKYTWTILSIKEMYSSLLSAVKANVINTYRKQWLWGEPGTWNLIRIPW